jgi:hypothetical protein
MFTQVALAATRLTAAGDEVKEGLADKIAGFFDYLIGRVPSWIAGFLVFVATIFIAKMAKAAVESRISDQVDEEHQEVLVLAGRVTYFGTLILGAQNCWYRSHDHTRGCSFWDRLCASGSHYELHFRGDDSRKPAVYYRGFH